MNEEMQAKLQELIDKDEIRDVFYRYCRGVDRRDMKLIESAFHPGASADRGKSISVPDLIDLLSGMDSDDTCYTHFVGNQLIEVEGDTAFAETYCISIRELESDGKRCTRMRGFRYMSRFERRDGVWKISDRSTADDWNRLDEITGRVPDIGVVPGRTAPTDPVYSLRDTISG